MKSLIVVLFFVLSGCGGGTSGSASTGGFVDKTFTGVLTDPYGKPLANANVEIVSTGASTTTDTKGAFSVKTTVPIGKNDVVITANDGSRYLVHSIVSEDGATVEVQLVYLQQVIRKYKNWQITARVDGNECENAIFGSNVPEELQSYIESDADIFGGDGITLEQFAEIKTGTKCNFKIEILKNGKPVSNLPYKAKILVCNTEALPATTDIDVPISMGQSGLAGDISVPFTIYSGVTDSIPTGVCGYEVQITGYGGLKLGGYVSITSKYARDNF